MSQKTFRDLVDVQLGVTRVRIAQQVGKFLKGDELIILASFNTQGTVLCRRVSDGQEDVISQDTPLE